MIANVLVRGDEHFEPSALRRFDQLSVAEFFPTMIACFFNLVRAQKLGQSARRSVIGKDPHGHRLQERRFPFERTSHKGHEAIELLTSHGKLLCEFVNAHACLEVLEKHLDRGPSAT